jgi:hypothetical protein
MNNTIQVSAHSRRKPAKPAAYVAKHEQLRADVEAIRRGELTDRPVSKAAHVLKSLAKFIGVEIRT